MSSSWDRPGPQRTVVDLHSYVGFWYGFLAVVFSLALAFGGKVPEIGQIVFLIVLAALCVAHRKTSDAAESNARWVPLVSVLLALPLLLSFPIGTYLAVRLIINAPQMDTAPRADEVAPTTD